MNYFSLFIKKTLRYLLKPLSFLPAFCMLYFILYMSSKEGTASADMSYQVSHTLVLAYNRLFSKGLSNEVLNQLIYQVHPLIRKTAHFTEFFALAVTVVFPLYVYKIRGIFLFLSGELFCILVAFLDEYSQSFVLGRNASYRDVIIDSTGAFFGVIAAWILCYIGRKTIFKFLSLEDYHNKKKEYQRKKHQPDL